MCSDSCCVIMATYGYRLRSEQHLTKRPGRPLCTYSGIFYFIFLFDFDPCAPWGANPSTGLGVLSLDGYHPIVMRSRLGIFFF